MRDDCVDWPAPWQMLIHVHSSWLITEKHQNIAIAVVWLRAETISDRFNRPTINKGTEQIPWPSTQSDYCLKSYRQTKSSDRQFQEQKQSKRDSWDSQKKQLRNQNTGSRRIADDELEACREVDDLNIKCEEGVRWSVPYCWKLNFFNPIDQLKFAKIIFIWTRLNLPITSDDQATVSIRIPTEFLSWSTNSPTIWRRAKNQK